MILHVDGDAFFASCEVAERPHLRGRPVVTGLERGIASAMSYEAKRMGVTRGMPIFKIKEICPDAVILPSNYETYSLYAERMYRIVRRFSAQVEEYSIDECFALLRQGYAGQAREIKDILQRELGITFSVGVAPNKVLAKVASKRNKPDGFAYIEHCDIDEYLRELPTDKLWGIGPRLSARLSALGVRTALQFKNKPLSWVSEYFERPGQDIWRELNGEKVFPLNLEPKTSYDSIQKFKTFTPATSDKNYLFSQLCKNIENACIKARRHKLIARKVAFVLRTREFRHRSHEEKLALPTAGPEFLCSRARENFERFWRRGERYRATGVVLGDLVPAATRPRDLFGESRALEKFERLHKTVDDIDARFGKHTVHLLSSLSAIRDGTVRGGKRVAAYRSEVPLSGETARRHIALPLLGKVW